MKTENQLQLVTFEQAKRLKEAGFDWYCDKKYAQWIFHSSRYSIGATSQMAKPGGDEYYAPTVALAIKWFGNKKRYYGYVEPMVFSDEFGYWIKRPGYLEHKWSTCQYDTCESAESALLDELLTLIEKQNEK